MDFANAQCDEIIQDGSGGTGLGTNVGDVMDGEVGFDGNFGFRRVDFEIAVEAEIADDCDAELTILAGEGLEAGCIHGYLSR